MKDKLKLLGFGILVGGLYTYMCMDIRMSKQRAALVDEINIRTNFLNWIATEGLELEGDEFISAYQERATFINLVTEGN